MFEFLFEFFCGVLGADLWRGPHGAWLSSIGFLLFGALLGGLGLLVFSAHFIAAERLRVLNLAFTPIAVGGCMAAIGPWRAKRGDPVLHIDCFAYGSLFALSFGVMIFFFAQ